MGSRSLHRPLRSYRWLKLQRCRWASDANGRLSRWHPTSSLLNTTLASRFSHRYTSNQNAGRRRAIGLTTVAVAFAVAIARADVELGSLIVVLVGAAALAADGLLAKQLHTLPLGGALLPAAIVVAEVTPLVPVPVGVPIPDADIDRAAVVPVIASRLRSTASVVVAIVVSVERALVLVSIDVAIAGADGDAIARGALVVVAVVVAVVAAVVEIAVHIAVGGEDVDAVGLLHAALLLTLVTLAAVMPFGLVAPRPRRLALILGFGAGSQRQHQRQRQRGERACTAEHDESRLGGGGGAKCCPM